MRATPLLLVLLAAAAVAPPVGPVTPRALLVPRSACAARDSAYFSADGLRTYALTANQTITWRDFRILSYNETCGADWRVSVVRGVVNALAAGETTVIAGRAGPETCELRALRGPAALSLPAACAAPRALAAAVLELAVRLHWRRALLPPHAGCARVLRAIAYELAAAGLFVRREPISRFEIDQRPHVVIVCCSDVEAVRGAARMRGAALLVLHLTPHDAHAVPHSRTQNFSCSMESLFIDSSYYIRRPRNSSHYVLTSLEMSRVEISTAPLDGHKNVSIKKTNEGLAPRSRKRRNLRTGRPNGTAAPHTLLLSDEPLELASSMPSTDAVYDEVLRAIARHKEEEETGVETAHNTYYLYESTIDSNRSWVPVVKLATSSVRPADGEEDWATFVNVIDPRGELQSWISTVAERPRGGGSSPAVTAWSASATCGALVALVAALAFRRARRRRRPRVAPILSAADFSFPADERRVGEGMENMVSWLQQLHGCAAGPGRPERPDAPHPAAVAALPSAPSSTCSVTRLAPDRRTLYKGEPVQLKPLAAGGALALRRRGTDVLLVLQALRHENVNPFIGCLAEARPARPALVFAACGRGSLEDVLMADDIQLDWTFRLSLLTDLVRGMRYLHASPLRAHGRLSSRNCAVDARWVLRVTDYGVAAFARAQGLPLPQRTARELLWTAPELLRELRSAGTSAGGAGGGTQAGDVFSFAIIMQEVIVRGEPYCMLPHSPEEILEKLCRPPPLVRPSVSLGAAPPEAVRVMRQCWAEAPALRPDFARLYHLFRHMHRGRKINIVDSMFEMLEKYSNNLEELIKERTEQLDVEKKKTEQLLNRMLPRPVAERLMMGTRVEPEEFEEVSIYFSDIVGFTALAARSSPVQVVDLLNDLYTTFDAAIEQYGVYKVETIGDAYMVVGGLPVRSRDHAERVATMALHLLHLAGRFRIRHLPATPLHLRIGLHTGPCCAGVVGLTMPRYCLFGDTVNTASRMESTGAAWRVQVSSATAARLAAAGGYRLRSRGLRQIKGKGAMHTYWLLGKEGFDKPLPTPPPLESEEVLFESDAENESERGDAEPAPRSPRSPRSPRQRARARAHSDAEEDCFTATCGSRTERAAWARSGAVSADSSPPRAPPVALSTHPRYRCLSSSARALRRQWSLERGDVLAAAAARAEPLAELLAEPLALRVPPPPRTLARYRTRPVPTDESRFS